MIGFAFLAAAAAAAPVVPACGGANKHALDFWIGTWTVVDTASNTTIATSRVTPVANGCAIQERYSQSIGPGGKPMRYEGRSYSAYNDVDARWHQFYVDTAGAAFNYVGTRSGSGAISLTAQAGKRATRMTLRREGTTVRQIGEISSDGGATFAPNYDFTYRPLRSR